MDLLEGLIKHRGAHYGLCDDVGVAVGRGPSVLQVALSVLAHLAGDADTTAAIGDTCRERVHAASFVELYGVITISAMTTRSTLLALNLSV